MLTSIAAGGLGALLTIAVGSPLAARLANAHVWRKSAPADQFSQRQTFAARNFEPLDFGPDDMVWPSESSRTLPTMPVPAWPSESWEDADFGRGAGARAAEIEEKNAARQAQDTQRRQNRVDDRSAGDGGRARRDAAQQQEQRASEKRRAEERARRQETVARQQRQRAEQERAEEQARAARQQQRSPPQRSPADRVRNTRPKPPPPKAAAASDGASHPDRAALEAMIQQLGLAGTVQHLMRENSWDFKTAAAWLARARKS